MHDLAVIIVTWNVRDLVLACLRSLSQDLAASTLTSRIVVVDSASTDGTCAALREQWRQSQPETTESGESKSDLKNTENSGE